MTSPGRNPRSGRPPYQAMADDTAELHRGPSLLKALDELAVETVVLRAPRGLLDEPGGLYAPGYLDAWAEKLPALAVREIPDVNHYTIVMGGAAPPPSRTRCGRRWRWLSCRGSALATPARQVSG